ncbi:unnamed protein product [Allacma fusca]|uniref:Uncharacterized protein n=1 Tax=Allacma fusca TaxID=39272 RepID=A0A8J2KPJ5_9HEXA|nr:unnamed protein product [Allacma fusca]
MCRRKTSLENLENLVFVDPGHFSKNTCGILTKSNNQQQSHNVQDAFVIGNGQPVSKVVNYGRASSGKKSLKLNGYKYLPSDYEYCWAAA